MAEIEWSYRPDAAKKNCAKITQFYKFAVQRKDWPRKQKIKEYCFLCDIVS